MAQDVEPERVHEGVEFLVSTDEVGWGEFLGWVFSVQALLDLPESARRDPCFAPPAVGFVDRFEWNNEESSQPRLAIPPWSD